MPGTRRTHFANSAVFWLSGLLLAGCQDRQVSADEPAGGEQPATSWVDRLQTVFQSDTYTVPSGTKISIRLGQAISTAANRSGDRFSATLDEAIEVDGKLLAPRGSDVVGRLTHVDDSDRVKGRAMLTMTLESLVVDGEKYRIHTHPIAIQAEGTKKDDATVIGGSTAAGAVIGAIAGGKKGAAVGAGVGAGAGTGYVLATKGKEVEYGPETRFTFTLSEDLELPQFQEKTW